MAKDGTNRGGRRRNTGPKPQAVSEKNQKGQAVKMMTNDIPTLDIIVRRFLVCVHFYKYNAGCQTPVFIHIFWFEQIHKTRNKKAEIHLNFLSVIN